MHFMHRPRPLLVAARPSIRHVQLALSSRRPSWQSPHDSPTSPFALHSAAPLLRGHHRHRSASIHQSRRHRPHEGHHRAKLPLELLDTARSSGQCRPSRRQLLHERLRAGCHLLPPSAPGFTTMRSARVPHCSPTLPATPMTFSSSPRRRHRQCPTVSSRPPRPPKVSHHLVVVLLAASPTSPCRQQLEPAGPLPPAAMSLKAGAGWPK
jgi:hypothetical protein